MPNTNSLRITLVATNLQTGLETGRITCRDAKHATRLIKNGERMSRGSRGYTVLLGG